ncbi:MAG: hypothetical protein M0009_15410 [Deltaproteobacteria bacterium]|nr:hypothetical protein [Deltaproteobacteria bacterium]
MKEDIESQLSLPFRSQECMPGGLGKINLGPCFLDINLPLIHTVLPPVKIEFWSTRTQENRFPEARLGYFFGVPCPRSEAAATAMSERLQARVLPLQRSEEVQGRKKILSAEGTIFPTHKRINTQSRCCLIRPAIKSSINDPASSKIMDSRLRGNDRMGRE